MENWIKSSIESKRLALTKKQTFFHYFFVLAFPIALISTVFLYLYSVNAPDDIYNKALDYVPQFGIYFSIAYAYNQYMALKLHQVEGKISKEEFKNNCESLVNEMGWIIESIGENYYVCTTEFKWTNWGTLVTIIHTDNSVLYTSICDLYNRPSTYSFGQNKRNKTAIQTRFEAL